LPVPTHSLAVRRPLGVPAAAAWSTATTTLPRSRVPLHFLVVRPPLGVLGAAAWSITPTTRLRDDAAALACPAAFPRRSASARRPGRGRLVHHADDAAALAHAATLAHPAPFSLCDGLYSASLPRCRTSTRNPLGGDNAGDSAAHRLCAAPPGAPKPGPRQQIRSGLAAAWIIMQNIAQSA